MYYRGIFQAALGALAVTCLLLPTTGSAQDAKPKVLKSCMQCHKGDSDDTIRGKLGNVSMKAEKLKVSTGSATWLVSFDEDTEVKGAEAINKIGKDKEVKVKFEEEDGILYATSVSVKQPAKLAEEDIIRLDSLAPLVAKGPQAGNFTIVDARPGKLFVTGHIPGALSIYDAQFDKNIAKLPENKEQLLVFYCGGPT